MFAPISRGSSNWWRQVVVFDGVAVRYRSGPPILSDVSFVLHPGSFHFLVGPSGAGKSSILKLMHLTMRPAAGRIELFGRELGELSRHDRAALRRRIGMVFQDFRLIEHLSATDNVALPLRIAGFAEPEILPHVRELLAWVGLADQLDTLPTTLSGGQQQRVAIARAVISRPNLLLADEPTGNVDEQLGVRLMYLFEELHKLGTTVVIATHNEHLVGAFPHDQLRIREGRLAPEPPGTRP